MGAVTFSLDIKLLEELINSCDFNFFVETGTFKGDTVDAVRSYFDNVRSVEMSQTLYEAAKERFVDDDKVNLLHGDSAEILGSMSKELAKESVLYWLDAHWCVADSTSGETSQCPLLMEIQQIQNLNIDSVILIDDARLFLAPPPAPHDVAQWPTLHQIIESLQSISTQHEIMVVNDIIAFYPNAAKPAVVKYARDHGVDWLNAANCLKQSGTFLKQLEEKEAVIQTQDQALKQAVTEQQHELTEQKLVNSSFLKQLEEKEAVIQEQDQALKQAGKDQQYEIDEQKLANNSFLKQLDEKDSVTQELQQQLDEKDSVTQELQQQLEEKEAVIQELLQQLAESNLSIVGRMMRIINPSNK